MERKKAVVIGSGFSGMSAACHMAKAGWQVTVIEKHNQPGGRARELNLSGFKFDMGPSWYWMPDVFERFFQQFGKKVSDYYTLVRLDPSYKVFFPGEEINIPASVDALGSLFEQLEPGSKQQLKLFLKEAEYKYNTGMHNLVYKPGISLLEFADADFLKGLFKLDVFAPVSRHVAKYFKHPYIRQILEFPVLFLGALPSKIPALYTLMNYADIVGGTWFPIGGMYSIVKAMHTLAVELGVEFKFGTIVKHMEGRGQGVKSVVVENNGVKGGVQADVFISSADYHHTEQQLLNNNQRNYNAAYWEKRVMAPGCLLYYIGLNKKLNNITHHTLFFDTSFNEHARSIYTTKQWPEEPMFYVSATTVTDASLAPEGCEALFFLIPVAAGLQGDDEATRDKYFNKIVKRFEERIGEKITDNIVVKKSYGYTDFVNDYSAFKGNAYGLANTLKQTAILKPSIKNKKLNNLFYTGQLTVPGPGVPPSLISGEVVAGYINKLFL